MDYPKSVPNVGLVNGKFVDENTTTGQVGSLIPSVWGNAVTEELLSVIRAGGDEPAENDNDQLLAAIKAIVRDSIPPEKIRTTLAEYGITDAYTKSVTYTKAEIEALLKNMSALPVGAMVPFPKGTVPPGFLEVDGSVQSTATYPDLAAYLGTTFNTGGEGAGNFRLPDSRGEFLRGWDHGRGMDPGRSIGTVQADAFQGHYHNPLSPQTSFVSMGSGGFGLQLGNNPGLSTTTGGPVTDGVNGVPRTASETRPRNVAVMWCIKAWNAPANQGNIDIAALALEVQKNKPIGIVGAHKNLIVSTSGLSAQVNVSADQLIVGSPGQVRLLSGVNLSFNGLTVGANGLDAGALAASTFYSVWVILSESGPAGLLSLHATDPKLPAGYTDKARVSWVRTDANGALKYPLKFVQLGRRARYAPAAGANLTASITIASGAATWPTAVSLAAVVPPTAASVSIRLSSAGSVSPSYVGPNQVLSSAASYAGTTTTSGSSCFQVEFVLEQLTLYWQGQAGASTLYCDGWEDSL